MSETGSSFKTRAKIALVVVALVLVIALIFQNTETVDTRLLFTTVSMPRAVLLFSTLAAGFLLGLVCGIVWRRKETKASA